MSARALLLLSLTAVTATLLDAAGWRTQSGREIDGAVRSVHGEFVVLAKGVNSWVVPMGQFAEAELPRLASAIAALPAREPVSWAESKARVTREVRGRLRIRSEGRLGAFDAGDRPEPEFYLAYFSAHWCGPCRRFTPKLVEAYHELKERHGGRFELIFISSDESVRAQERYIAEADMPWPFLPKHASAPSIEKWSGDGIPCLVVMDRDGVVLFHSYRGKEYLGPEDPLQKFAVLLESPGFAEGGHAANQHSVAVLMHLQNAGAESPVKPYWTAVDWQQYARLPDGPIPVRIKVARDGTVEWARPGAEISEIAAMRLRSDLSRWLFLPEIRGGVAVEAEIEVNVTRPARLSAWGAGWESPAGFAARQALDAPTPAYSTTGRPTSMICEGSMR